jgi:hypothetical protein
VHWLAFHSQFEAVFAGAARRRAHALNAGWGMEKVPSRLRVASSLIMINASTSIDSAT